MKTKKKIKDAQLIDRAAIANKEVLSFAEACVYTGLSYSYMYKLTSGRQIPHSKPTGKLVFFNRAELEQWLLSNRVATNGEIADRAETFKRGGVR